MTTTALGFEAHLDEPFEAALERVTRALKDQGFGILSQIDVKEALKEKLDVDFRDYVILGACNPKLAHQALSARPDVGLLLPCNVTLEAEPTGGVIVRIVDPQMMLETGGLDAEPAIADVAEQARELLRLAAASLSWQT